MTALKTIAQYAGLAICGLGIAIMVVENAFDALLMALDVLLIPVRIVAIIIGVLT